MYFEKNHDESIREFEKVILISDDEDEIINAYGFIGLNKLGKGDFKSAADYLNMVLQKRPADELALTYKMIGLEKARDLPGAAECAERIIQINPKNREVLFKLIKLSFIIGDWEKPLKWLEHTKTMPHTKALCLFYLERYDEAIDTLKNIKSVQSYFLIGKCYEKQSKITKSVKYLLKSFEYSLDVETLLDIADLFFEIEDWSKAIFYYSKALSFDDENEYTLERISECYVMTDDYDMALTHAQKLIEINSNSEKAYLIMGDAYLLLQDFEKASEIVKKGLEKNPESGSLWMEKGGTELFDDIGEAKRSIHRQSNWSLHVKIFYKSYYGMK